MLTVNSDCSVCDKNAICSNNNGVAECICKTGYSGNGYKCSCLMFEIKCDVITGFDVSINETCKHERFPNAPKESQMMVTAHDILDNPENITNPDEVPDKCVFDGNSSCSLCIFSKRTEYTSVPLMFPAPNVSSS